MSEETNDENIDIINSQEYEEQKTYINCGCFQLSIGIIYTYTYIAASILLNIINRVIFLTYKFKFNIFFLFLQQIICLLLFSVFGNKNKTFKKQAGELSIKDFMNFKYYYILFTLVFTVNVLSSFIANQIVINTTMFVTLRKFVLLMIFIIDFFFANKKFTKLTILCIFLMTSGALIIGLDDFTTDYVGYLMVFINNVATVIYIKFTENFRKKTGFTNLKLLVYNSYLIVPILIILIFISGEYKKIYLYFHTNNNTDYNLFGFYYYLTLSCALCVVLNSSFFLSNEKTSSLITQLLSNSKDIFVSGLSFIMLKDNNFSFNKIIGLIISTIGAILISSNSILENLKIGGSEKKYYIPIPISSKNEIEFESNKLESTN